MSAEINILVAEFCGWTEIRDCDYQPAGTNPYIDGPDQIFMGFNPETLSLEPLPDYCNDLNAVHEAEKILFKKDPPFIQRNYYQTLDKITGDQWNTVVATAQQRSEALARMIEERQEENEQQNQNICSKS